MIDLRAENSDVLAWQGEQDAAARTHLADLPGRAHFGELVRRRILDTGHTPPTRRGDLWFQRVALDPEADQQVLAVRTSPTGEPRVLFDPNAYSAARGGSFTVLTWSASPDGKRLAVTVDEAGKERPELLLVDVERGELLDVDIPWTIYAGVSWLPDSSGFWCSTRLVSDGAYRQPRYRYVFGEPLPEEIQTGQDTPFTLVPEVSPNGRYVLLPTGNTEVRLDRILVDGELRPFLEDVPGSHQARFDGDDAIAILEDTPRAHGRLVRIPVATATDRSTWTELLPESDDVLRCLEIVDGHVVLGVLRDAAARLRVLDLRGVVVDEPDLPGRGIITTWPIGGSAHPSLPMITAGDHEVAFAYSTFARSPAVYRYLPAERRLEELQAPALVGDDLTVSVITATSADGTPVPAHVVHRSDLDLSVPRPTIVYGYGGFNLAKTPGYEVDAAAWVEAGGIWVLAHLRGGGEFGPEWWRGGRRDTKQRSFDDLYAVAERVVELGLSSREKLAARGESNGGLLTGAALVQRPDLWAAVASDVPVYDLVGYRDDPLTFAIGAVEYGDPGVPDEERWLRALSPVHNVKPAVYPQVLVTAGANDPRCPAWHSRLLVDRVQRADEGGGPILLRVYEDQGHGSAGLTDTAGKIADWLAFVADATGLTP
jgi:prolyl oligopeptidase